MLLLNNLQNVEENILDRNDSRISEMLLLEGDFHLMMQNEGILNAAIQCKIYTKRFDVSPAIL